MSILGRIQKWIDRQGGPPNPLRDLNVASNVAQLGILRQNAQVQHATQVRLMAKMLGVPPTPMEDDMLAGGDIKIGSNIGPWLFATAVLFLLAFAWWTSQPKAIAAVSTVAPVSPPAVTTTVPGTPSKSDPNYIEFYKP